MRTPDLDEPTLLSLFAGAGGLDIGLEQAGFVTVAVNELASHACETLRANKLLSELGNRGFEKWFDEVVRPQRCYRTALRAREGINELERLRVRLKQRKRGNYLRNATIVAGDVRKVSVNDWTQLARVGRGNLDLIAGGPPCQPFSRAGKRQTLDVEDGRLFMEFVRIVDGLRPRWFLFENVKGIAQSKTTIWYVACSNCSGVEYPTFSVDRTPPAEERPAPACSRCSSLETKWVLQPNRRGGSLELIMAEFERLGYRSEARVLNAVDFGAPQFRERVFVIGSRDGEVFNWPIPTHVDGAVESELQLALPVDARPRWRAVADELWQDGHPDFGALNKDVALLWVKNVVRPHAEPVTWTLRRPSPTIGAHQAAKLALAPFGVPEEQLARQQWHTLGRRQGDSPPVDVVHSYLSDEDLLRLQTFPPSWYLHGTRMERAFQVGNAVPPVLAQAVGAAILGKMGAAPNVAACSTSQSAA